MFTLTVTLYHVQELSSIKLNTSNYPVFWNISRNTNFRNTLHRNVSLTVLFGMKLHICITKKDASAYVGIKVKMYYCATINARALRTPLVIHISCTVIYNRNFLILFHAYFKLPSSMIK